MRKVYQFIRVLKLQILSSKSNVASVTTPGFPIFLALIMLLVIPFSILLEHETTIPATLFESTVDSFRVQVPEDWVIQDVDNTGPMSIQESTQGYGILAQLCQAEEGGEERGQQQQQQQQQQDAVTNVTSSGSCQQQQQAQQDIIHIIRYPNLGAQLGIAVEDINDIIPDSILNYQIQKLQDVGYRDIDIVNSTDTAILLYYPGGSGRAVATLPSTLVEITYSTDFAPNEMRRGYFISTATNVTPPNLETITGYSIFYEVGSSGTAARAEKTTQSASLPRVSQAVGLIVNSFQLIASEEAQVLIAEAAREQISSNQRDDTEEESSQLTSATPQNLYTTSIMIIVYSLLIIGVVWKFIGYMREKTLTQD